MHKKMVTIKEVRSRDARVIAVATVGSDLGERCIDDPILVRDIHLALQPIVAYPIAKLCSCDLDKPRNSAKSVLLFQTRSTCHSISDSMCYPI
jgi:glucosamine 6-phosphate synthetase-like amidotransferase/phosphosugar isomerase protein